MAARPALKRALRSLQATNPYLTSSSELLLSSRPFSTTLASRSPGAYSPPNHAGRDPNRETHFGFETVTEAEKEDRVAGVFTSVAESYDRMNDLMSFGWHRVWKYAPPTPSPPSPLLPVPRGGPLLFPSWLTTKRRDHFVASLNPGFSPLTAGPDPRAPQHILDIAGGTGDIAFRMLHTAHVANGNPDVRVTISDINPAMLRVGQQRSEALPASQQAALRFVEANAEDLAHTRALSPLSVSSLDNDAAGHAPAASTSAIPDASVDLYTVAFGIRNFSNIPAALREAHRVLKPGGVFACLEFSKVDRYPLLNTLYKRWSFGAIPLIGQLVAGDRDSYQYLVESIERFPSQEAFAGMIVDAGFVVGGQGYEDLTGGIAAIHKGMKPR